MIQKLNDQGEPPTYIMQIRWHKNGVQMSKQIHYSVRATTKKHVQHSEWISRSAGVIRILRRYLKCFDSECD